MKRPVEALHRNPGKESKVWDGPVSGLDIFWIDDQEFGLQHFDVKYVRDCVAQIKDGKGWEKTWPLPIVVVSNLRYGRLIYDTEGIGKTLGGSLDPFPNALKVSTAAAARDQYPGYRDQLKACVDRGDSWLFHDHLVEILRILFIAWFSSNDVYWPFQKRLSQNIQRFRLPSKVTELEQDLWTKVSLDGRLESLRRLADAIFQDLW